VTPVTNGGDRYHSCPEITEPLREIRILFVVAPWRSAILLVVGAEHRSKALMARQSGYRLAEERKRHGLTSWLPSRASTGTWTAR
jgi:hypothetical protein